MTTVTIRDRGHERRERYEDRDDGRVDVITETMTKGGQWRSVGHEVVESVEIEAKTEQ